MVKSWEVKIMAYPKILADEETPAARENRRMVKSLRALKSPCLVKYPWPWNSWRNWKSTGPAYCLGSAESPTTDFSLVPLMSTFFLVDVMNLACSLKVRNGLLVPSFYGRTLSRTVLAVCTGPPCQEMAQIHAATKSLASPWKLEFYWFLSNYNNF